MQSEENLFEYLDKMVRLGNVLDNIYRDCAVHFYKEGHISNEIITKIIKEHDNAK